MRESATPRSMRTQHGSTPSSPHSCEKPTRPIDPSCRSDVRPGEHHFLRLVRWRSADRVTILMVVGSVGCEPFSLPFLAKPGDCEKQETESVLWQNHSGGPAVKSPKMRIVLDRSERGDSMDQRSVCARLVMTRYLALCLLPGLLLATNVSVRGSEAEFYRDT